MIKDNKKAQKQIIKLALAIRNASDADLFLLGAFTQLKLESKDKCYQSSDKYQNLICDIEDNEHLLAILGIKSK